MRRFRGRVRRIYFLFFPERKRGGADEPMVEALMTHDPILRLVFFGGGRGPDRGESESDGGGSRRLRGEGVPCLRFHDGFSYGIKGRFSWAGGCWGKGEARRRGPMQTFWLTAKCLDEIGGVVAWNGVRSDRPLPAFFKRS